MATTPFNDALRSTYEAGRTIRELGMALSVSYETIRQRLLAAGTCLRRSGPRGSFSRKLMPSEVSEIRSRLAGGERQANLAREFGVSRQNVHSIATSRIWKDIGVQIPDSGTHSGLE